MVSIIRGSVVVERTFEQEFRILRIQIVGGHGLMVSGSSGNGFQPPASVSHKSCEDADQKREERSRTHG